MFQLQNISYSIDHRLLLSQINWVIEPARRYALIGPNGAGKTTLFRIMTGTIIPDQGEIIKPKNYIVGHLPQEELSFHEGTVLSTALQGQPKLSCLEAEIQKIQEQLKQKNIDRDSLERLVQKLGDLDHQFGMLGGYEREAQTKKILHGLGFGQADFSRPVADLSGGWRMRVYLTRLLLQQLDLLLLDEPTNHLDLPALEWLERFLLKFKGSVIIVSHDRFFIKRLADEIVELDHRVLTQYAGRYHFYEAQKELRREQLIKKDETLHREKEDIKRFVERFRYKATKARQVQSRIKHLDKMERVEIPDDIYQINFRIHCPVKSYHDVCLLQNISFGYDQKPVIKDLNFNLYRGERVALIGANGSGKTTLTRIMVGQLEPQQGNVHRGQNVAIGYYAQHQVEVLDSDKTILEEVTVTTADIYRSEVRNILGIFHFSGNDVEKKIAVLSGGEKARACLAKILLSPVNFLIMDEPTNHLDLVSKEALEKALSEYDGSLLIISHDRYFLDKLVNQVIELKDGVLQHYAGNYSYYLDKKDISEEYFPATKIIIDQAHTSEASFSRKEEKRREALARQNISLRRNDLKTEIKKLEQKIESMEKDKKELENLMTDSQFYKQQEKAAEKIKYYQELIFKLPTAYQEWEQLNGELEDLLQSVTDKNRGF
jgi:ATP-binding cassette subfamily F protein 3